MQVSSAVDARRPTRQDTFDLREQMHQDVHAHADAASATYTDEEEHSMIEDDSEGEEQEEYMDDEDDASSDLSIPNESIDFDLVYSLHSFAATVEGQANVVRGDSLFLMDDSNSYWWLVRVLKTQEVGYIPAENIETPFERLARLNKHRNVDLASATQAELNEGLSQERARNTGSRAGRKSPSPLPGRSRSRVGGGRNVQFTPALFVHRYPPAIWKEDEIEDPDIEWDDEGYEDEDPSLAEDFIGQTSDGGHPGMNMEPDDGMSWDDEAVQTMQARQLVQAHAQGADVAQGGSQPSQQQLQQQQQQQQQHQVQLQQEQVAQLQAQQQRELTLQQQQVQPQQQAASQVQIQPLRPSNSRERLVSPPQDAPRAPIDPLQVTETRKLTVTPNIARDSTDSAEASVSSIVERQRQQQQKIQEEERTKRIREEEQAEEARKKAKGKDRMASPVSSASYGKPSGGKLRKEPKDTDEDSNSGKEKKKKGGMFGGLFGRKKDKKDNKSATSSTGSVDSNEIPGRASEESRSSSTTRGSITADTHMGMVSPTTATAMQQQQAQGMRISNEAKRSIEPHTPDRSAQSQVSQHASQLRQRDQQQQALYQKYLNSSPSSPPEAPSYGLQSAPIVMGSTPPSAYNSPTVGNNLGLPPTSKPRPGSLILTQSIMDGAQGTVPELSVVRVFAGKNLQTEATFKTVLLNSSTTSADLIRQATQRFRLSLGSDDTEEYFLTIKQVEGGASAVLRSEEKPLVVFEQLVMETETLPKVKRSSVGSISSISSNLSLHPAIKKLSMNDFTDDSAVKFYLNRKGDNSVDDSVVGHGMETDETIIADDPDESLLPSPYSPRGGQLLSPPGGDVTPGRFTSPTYRFALQVLIYPDDLPDDMAFHPYTEAIVFKDTLRASEAAAAPTVSPAMRRKVFVFPKNVTVAEVIEIGLERFGISEGVVDGGDEIEDKGTKRKSSSRVRYGLYVDTSRNGSPERELTPSSKVIDAFPRPPTYRAPERPTPNNKRRSVDSTLLLGSLEDVNSDDPVFILRRAISYRNSTSRHRMSAPLDEIALQKFHRDSYSSANSDPNDSGQHKQQPSRQEIIARQREATRANQRAILTAQSNSLRGMDVLLPGNAVLRSSRYDINDRMRYSYVEPDGETYDISDIVEEELRDSEPEGKNDLLEGVLGRKDVVGEKLNRVLSKIKIGKQKDNWASRSSMDSSRRSASISEYSMTEETVRQPTPTQSRPLGGNGKPRPGTTTPTGRGGAPTTGGGFRRNPSIASVMSDLSGVSGYDTAISHPTATSPTSTHRSWGTPTPTLKPQLLPEKKEQKRRIRLPKDDFGVSHMMAIIEYKSAKPKAASLPTDPVDELLFGKPADLDQLHPSIREIYAPAFKKLEEIDKMLDDHLSQVLADR